MRLNRDGLNGPSDLGGHERGRHAGVGADHPVVLSNDHRLIDDHGLTHIKDRLRGRQDDHHQRGRDDVRRPDEQPKIRLVLHRNIDLLGRHRRPADGFLASAPGDPGRTPFRAGHPDPAEPEIAIEHPAPVVIGNPAPFLVGDPVPAPLIGVDPVTGAVGPPIDRYVRRDPHRAPARMLDPAAVSAERLAEFAHHLLGLDRPQRCVGEKPAQSEQRDGRGSQQARDAAADLESEHVPLRGSGGHQQMIPPESSSAGVTTAGR